MKKYTIESIGLDYDRLLRCVRALLALDACENGILEATVPGEVFNVLLRTQNCMLLGPCQRATLYCAPFGLRMSVCAHQDAKSDAIVVCNATRSVQVSCVSQCGRDAGIPEEQLRWMGLREEEPEEPVESLTLKDEPALVTIGRGNETQEILSGGEL